MRQRNIKNLDERIEANANYLIEDPRACRGHWREIFGNENPIYLEIGCGKGQFITAHAAREPNSNFIACEGQASVVLRALEKAEEQSMDNLRIFIDYVHDLADYFEPGGDPLSFLIHDAVIAIRKCDCRDILMEQEGYRSKTIALAGRAI